MPLIKAVGAFNNPTGSGDGGCAGVDVGKTILINCLYLRERRRLADPFKRSWLIYKHKLACNNVYHVFV